MTIRPLRGALRTAAEPCLSPSARTRYLGEDQATAETRWLGCETACWSRAFPDENIEHAACPRKGAPLQPVDREDDAANDAATPLARVVAGRPRTSTTTHEPTWSTDRRFGQRLPGHVVYGGQEVDLHRQTGRALIICRAMSDAGDYQPGKIVEGRCNYGNDGIEHIANKFQVLLDGGAPLRWVAGKKGRPRPAYAVRGGQKDGQPLYVCRVRRGTEGVHPGKLIGDTCNYSYGGRDFVTNRYDVLTVDPDGANP